MRQKLQYTSSAPLAKVGLPPGVLVAALHHEGRILVPSGVDRVQAGDRVLCVSRTEQVAKLTDFL